MFSWVVVAVGAGETTHIFIQVCMGFHSHTPGKLAILFQYGKRQVLNKNITMLFMIIYVTVFLQKQNVKKISFVKDELTKFGLATFKCFELLL